MGLSSKQVTINRDGLDWCSTQTLLQSSLHDHQISLELLHHRKLPPSSSTTTTMRRQQNNQQQSEPLKCPRCDSINTKFCYYNNYNKSQPRHFCRTCKRHWTKGGTLRNVPVGGGRKNNKRPNKKSASTATTAAASAVTKEAMFQAQQPNIIRDSISIFPNNNNLTLGDLHQDEKSTTSEILSQTVLIPPQSLNISPDLDSKSLITNKANTGFNFLPNQSQQFQAGVFSSSTSSPFESSLSSISNSFQTSNVVCDYGTDDQFKFMGDQATVTSSCTVQPPWQVPAATSNGMDLSNYWNWEDIDTLVSADHIDLPWDDSHDFKP